jgi:hypothetical protein
MSEPRSSFRLNQVAVLHILKQHISSAALLQWTICQCIERHINSLLIQLADGPTSDTFLPNVCVLFFSFQFGFRV